MREHHDYLASKQTAVWRHHYDELNERIGTIRPGGHSIEWLTYGAGHAHGLMLDGQEVVGFERDDLHREVIRMQGNGLAPRQQYDPVGRLLEQQVSSVALAMPPAQMGVGAFSYQPADRTALGKPAAILRQYQYDKAGQLTSVADSRRGQINYRYDPVGRLLAATSAIASERFAFDPASNMVDAGPIETDRPVTGNRVLDNLIKEYAGTSYRHDERGNLVEQLHNGKRTTFGWDAFGRMVQANTPQGGATYAYDALGRRIIKYSEAQGKGTHTLFGWDGDTLAFESNIVRSTATDMANAAHTVHYVYERGSFVPIVQARRSGSIALHPTTDVKALMEANEGNYDIHLDPLWNGEFDDKADPGFTSAELAFYQCDHLGTPQELTDADGHIAWSAQYKAWGLAQEAVAKAKGGVGLAGEDFSNPIRFQGQYFDEETGLHYNRYRYYDPASGTFASKDPIGLRGGVNEYRYSSNPNFFVDPLGLQPCHGLSDQQKRKIAELKRRIADHHQLSDYKGMIKDLQGNPVPRKDDPGYFQHFKEVSESMNGRSGLRAEAAALKRSASNPNLCAAAKAELLDAVALGEKHIKMYDEITNKYGKAPPPHSTVSF